MSDLNVGLLTGAATALSHLDIANDLSGTFLGLPSGAKVTKVTSNGIAQVIIILENQGARSKIELNCESDISHITNGGTMG
jgi:hypothetical protein